MAAHRGGPACYGQPDWPSGVPVPQASLEFEPATPDAVPTAAAELAGQGHQLLHDARTEPWGQVIARLLSPEGMVVGVCYTPWFHEGAGRAGHEVTGAGEPDEFTSSPPTS